MATGHECKSIAYTYSETTTFYEYMFDTRLLAEGLEAIPSKEEALEKIGALSFEKVPGKRSDSSNT